MEFMKHKWPEILILVIIIPGFLGLGKLSWDLSDRPAREETRTADGRMSEIKAHKGKAVFCVRPR